MISTTAGETINDRPVMGYIGRIPVRNLWFLMLYASDLFRAHAPKKVCVEDNPDDIPDLVAEILCHHVEHRIHRNLSYGYQSREAVLNRVRGRIDLFSTERHRLMDRGKIACRFDALTVDTPRNRYVRTALEAISRIVHRPGLAYRCRSLAGSFVRMGVTGERPGRFDYSIHRFGRHDVQDQPMVAAAQLALNLALPTEEAGTSYLSSPYREDTWVRRLFEKGVAGFYDVVLSSRGWRVSAGKSLSWQIQDKSPGIDPILPSMRTDIILDHEETACRMVIDTKFTAILTPGWYREETLRSGYLYQMYSYLMSQDGNGDPLNDHASGLLLHPAVGVMVNEWVKIQNHAIRFATVDLTASTQEIREQLLRIVGIPPEKWSS